MAAFAMAGGRDTLLLVQQTNIRKIERFAKRIRMERLAPLMVRGFVAVLAVLCGRESHRLDEFPILRRRHTWQEWLFCAQGVVVILGYS